MTSLMWASWGEHVECTRVLLEGGAQANQQDNVSGYEILQCLLVMCFLVGMWGCGKCSVSRTLCALEHAGHVEMHGVNLYGL